MVRQYVVVYSLLQAKNNVILKFFVPHLRNSQMLNGREEVKLIDPVARINVKRNNIGNSRSIDMVVYAKRLEVVGGNK